MQSSALLEASRAIDGNDLDEAERLLRAYPASGPEGAEAARLLARIATARGLMAEAERLLRKAIAMAPDFVFAHADLSSLLSQAGRADEAIAMLEDIAAREPRKAWALSLETAVLAGERRFEKALAAHRRLLARAPQAAVPWMNYGHMLGIVGRTDEAIAAYRRSLSLDAANGFAWRGLANLRSARLGWADVAQMEAALQRNRQDVHRLNLHFALGQVLRELGGFEASFRHYEAASRLRDTLIPYDPRFIEDLVGRIETVFTTDFFAARQGQGHPAQEAVFVVGMPRSGTTLIEQILASHPQVEGAGELFALGRAVHGVAGAAATDSRWPDALPGLPGAQIAEIGERYRRDAGRFLRTERPVFVDKMPSNWQYLGVIGAALPRARIINVSRDAVACCFSNFTTYFNLTTRAPNSLEQIAGHYRAYGRAMSHFRTVMPGQIYELRYERLIDDIEGETRRLLTWLGLPFDSACLRFHENDRPVDTPSAQQVRVPLNRRGLDSWRAYAAWLAPLERQLGADRESVPAAD